MNTKALNALEYPKIVEMLVSRAASALGKERAGALLPMTDLEDICRAQKETTEAVGFILRKGSLPIGGIKNISEAIARASVGGKLMAEELLHVGECLYVFGKILAYGENTDSVLAKYFQGITPDKQLEAEISRCIKPAGEIADNASAKLSEIRREIRKAHDKIREKLQEMLHSASHKNMLQDAIVTLRGERFCVPVKAEFRGSFPGMVHDQSSTGATVFMEPLSVVNLNNSIKDLHFIEKREEDKILQKLSGMVWENAEVLDANIAIVTTLDFIFAKAELSLQMNACEPLFNSRRFINIRKGRHPLLITPRQTNNINGVINKDAVVPTDIYLGDEFSMLLITGPNTGGKTVTLKTVGLFTCMGQAGLHIPANDSSELAVFDDVFADIGDEQSIEQSLSTFSSHMSNIVGILGKISPNALVLLDELGAGTDPTEGAALAIALLGHLHAQGIRTVVTTHYSELKLYALSTQGVENASCEFDVETLRPTYRLLIGIPGKSNAFAIAKRLGLNDEIIDTARGLLSQKDIRFEDVITDLEASKKQVLIEQDRAAGYRRDAEKLREDAAKLEEKLRTQRDKILQQAREEALQVVYDAKKESEALVSQMRKELDAAALNASGRELEEAGRKAREGITALGAGITPVSSAPARKLLKNLRRGDKVFIHSMNQSGTVSSPPDANGETQIQAGIMKIKVHVRDLSLDEEDPAEKAAAFIKKRRNAAGGFANESGGRIGKSMHISPETDLRGLMPEEATSKAESYLDEAFLASLSTVTLIHGKGTGALRKAIQSMLKRHPNVKEFRSGKYGEGEDGVTIVTFR
ncbi:MAG: endonuclease MutS2 [Defluviitaleaceae bacterium]|nr:endonuclease MutS2 [Defluviitaleaceae bacterium]